MIDLHIFPTTEHTAAAVQNNSNNNNNKNHHAALQPSIILTPASTTAQLAGGQRSHDGCRFGTLRPQSVQQCNTSSLPHKFLRIFRALKMNLARRKALLYPAAMLFDALRHTPKTIRAHERETSDR